MDSFYNGHEMERTCLRKIKRPKRKTDWHDSVGTYYFFYNFYILACVCFYAASNSIIYKQYQRRPVVLKVPKHLCWNIYTKNKPSACFFV